MVAILVTSMSFGQELVLNGGFETWTDSTTPADWTKAENTTQESTEIHSGTYAAKHTASGTKDISQTIEGIVPGNTYTISLWYKVESGDDTDARIWSYWRNAGSNVTDAATDGALRGPNNSYFDTNGNQWTQYTVDVVAPAGVDSFYFEVRSYGSAIVYWDDFSFQQVSNPDPTLTISSPSEGQTFAPGTTSVDVSVIVQNFVVGNPGSGIDGHIHWTVNGNAQPMKYNTDAETVTVADGQSYTVFMQLVDNSHQPISPAVNATVNFSVGSLITVADITALRADVDANGLGRYYEITGNSLVTHTDSFRNRKWIQDTSISGILIYDQPGTITTTYNVGDMVSGLRGTTTLSNGVLRFVPTSDAGTVVSSGNSVVPQVVSIADLNANPDNYESELIELQNVTFEDGDGTAVFATGTNYNVTDGSNTIIKRTDFYSADYIGQVIPSNQISSLVAISGEYNGSAQVYVRNLNDITLSNTEFEISTFSIYPNPTNTGLVTINSKNNAAITVTGFDILGKQVLNTNVVNNTLDVSNLKAGMYILKISQDNTSVTKKLIIK